MTWRALRPLIGVTSLVASQWGDIGHIVRRGPRLQCAEPVERRSLGTISGSQTYAPPRKQE